MDRVSFGGAGCLNLADGMGLIRARSWRAKVFERIVEWDLSPPRGIVERLLNHYPSLRYLEHPSSFAPEYGARHDFKPNPRWDLNTREEVSCHIGYDGG